MPTRFTRFTIPVLTIFALVMLSTAALAITSVTSVSLDYAFLDKWEKTMGGAIPLLPPADTVVPGQYFIVYPFLMGYGVDSTGATNVTWDMNILSPSGDTIFTADDEVALNVPVDNPSYTQLSQALLNMSCEKDYERGRYHISLKMTDHVTGDTCDDTASFFLTDFAWPKWEQKGLEKFGPWMQDYYKDPKPIEALGAFMELAQTDVDESGIFPMYGFFYEIFTNNIFLQEKLLERYPVAPDSAKAQMLTLLYYLGYTDPDLYSDLTPGERAHIDYLQGFGNPFNDTIVTNNSQLDIFWSRFFASGKYCYVRYVVKALEYGKYYEIIQNFDTTRRDDSAYVMDANKGAWFQSAMWSLMANCLHYRLVQDYCVYMYQRESLTDDEKLYLGMVLQKLQEKK